MLKNISNLKKNENISSKLKALLAIASIDIDLDFERILHDILNIACKTIDAHSGTMMLVDDRTGELRIAASYNLGTDYIDRVYDDARKAADIFQEPKDRPGYDLSGDQGISSAIFIPMKRGDNTIGLLNVCRELPCQFTDEDIDFVTLAASQAVSVIMNAKLKAELKCMEIGRHLVRDGDRINEIYSMGRDITEKKKFEQKLRDYNEKPAISCDELIEIDRLKTKIISNVTHELLTPLTSIKGFTELLQDETSVNNDEEQKKKLDIIYRNTERLIVLIKELLDISNLEKNTFGLHFRLVSMNDIIVRSIKDIHLRAKDKEISIIRDIKKLPSIWGDEERLNHVMTNLLENAIKFTPRNGTVTITAGENTKDIRISITDTGIGIPEDKLTRIFEGFYQIDSSTDRKYGGAGIGLSLCKSIIENHYGSIWAESTGCGSTFNILLPKLDQSKK